MGTQWVGGYGLWEPFWNSIRGWLGSPGGPLWRGSPVLMGITGLIWCVPEREGGTHSCLDEADELRNSLCLLRSSERPNPRSVSCSDRHRYNTQDREGYLLPLLRDEFSL